MKNKSKILSNKKHLLNKKQNESLLENWKRFCWVKRRLRIVVVKKKQIHLKTLLDAESKSNNKSFFFETFICLTGKYSGSTPNLIVEHCQYFNQFFTPVAEELNGKGNGNWNPDKIAQIMMRLKKTVMFLITKYTSKSLEISVLIILFLIFGILNTMTFFRDKTLKVQTFPDCLKRANVASIFKSGIVFVANTYRPISLLPAISKLFEKRKSDHFPETYKWTSEQSIWFSIITRHHRCLDVT